MRVFHLLVFNFFVLFFAIQPNTSYAVSDLSGLVKGFSNYQAGRIENIVLDNFITNFPNQKYVNQFFPETAKFVKGDPGISGKRIIPLMLFYGEADLNHLVDVVSCINTNMKVFSNEKLKIQEKKDIEKGLLTIDWLVTFRRETSFTTIDFLIENACEGFENTKYTNNWQDRRASFIELSSNKTIPPVNKYSQLLTSFNPCIETEKFRYNAQNINALLSCLVKKDSEINYPFLPTFTIEKNSHLFKNVDFEDFLFFMNSLSDMVQKHKFHVEHSISSMPLNERKTIYVHQFSMALSALGFQIENRLEFQKFKSTSIFLASLYDVAIAGDDSDAISGVIDDFVNEDVAYKNKRNPTAMFTYRHKKTNLRCNYLVRCHNTWFLGSYYGFSAGYLDGLQASKTVEYRSYGPIGFEFKLFSHPYFTSTFMAAPFDLGVYITNELRGSQYEVEFIDILSPSYFISFSMKQSPMALLIGRQHNIPTGDSIKSELTFVALSFDLPLVTLW